MEYSSLRGVELGPLKYRRRGPHRASGSTARNDNDRSHVYPPRHSQSKVARPAQSKRREKEFLSAIKDQLMRERDELEKKISQKKAVLAARTAVPEVIRIPQPAPAEKPIMAAAEGKKPAGDMNV